jgi:hypothetical protein
METAGNVDYSGVHATYKGKRVVLAQEVPAAGRQVWSKPEPSLFERVADAASAETSALDH